MPNPASVASSYKRRHKPNMNENAKFRQGYYTSTSGKCLTRENIYRSSWEIGFYEWCDRTPAVVRWASEPIAVEYRNPVGNLEYCAKNKLDPNDPRNWPIARYYTDAWIELQGSDGKIRKIFVEIKPYCQTQRPQPVPSDAPLRQQKAFNRAARIYLQNSAKWAAAKKYFESRGAEFMVFTEHTLEKLGIL